MSTTREIAEQITIEVAKVCGCNWESCTSVRTATTDAIDRALQAEREPRHLRRLQSAVVQAVIEERRLERLADEGINTIVRTDALIAVYGATEAKRSAVDALIAFEAENGIGE